MEEWERKSNVLDVISVILSTSRSDIDITIAFRQVDL